MKTLWKLIQFVFLMLWIFVLIIAYGVLAGLVSRKDIDKLPV